jgi:hypothetical protein
VGYDEDRGMGWITFAGVLLLTVGVLNLIEGIAAIGNTHFFVAGTHYIAGDLKAWGWTVTLIGAIQLLVGLGVFSKNQLARWTGVVILGLGSIATLLMMSAYPFWSLCIFAIQILAIYGLVAYGNRIAD